MRVLVIGGTGTVGSEVVKNLLKHPEVKVRVITSSKEKINKLPKNVEGVEANLKNKSTLPAAFKDVDGVFLLNALDPNETEQGLAAVEAAKKAGIKKIVYMSVHKLEDIKDAPHFYGKIPIENAVKSSGIDYAILRPNNFFQNDNWFKQGVIEYNVYPQPIGNKGLNRVDIKDIADAAVNALLNNDFNGRTFSLVGSDILTGKTTAEIYSKYLDKKINYMGDDLDAWAKQAKAMLPDWMVEDFKIMYKHFQDHGFLATEKDKAETKEILGKEPRKFDDFVKDLSKEWKQ